MPHSCDFGDLSLPNAPDVRVAPPGPASRELLSRQAERESNARSYPRRLPIALAEARGATVRDVDGNVYIDCLAGAGSLNVGHNNPVVLRALQACLEQEHIVTSLDLPTRIKDRFTTTILDLMPVGLRQHGRIQFCGPAGTDAVDAALKLCKIATGRHDLVSFRGAYHGMGQGPLSLMGATGPKEGLGALLAGVHFMPYGYCLRCPLELTPAMCRQSCASVLGTALQDPFSGMLKPAAVILEAIQGEGGVVVPPDGWLRAIAGHAAQAGVPLICDEIQSGIGRTGRWFAFEHDGITPDVVVLSKSIGGAGLPLAVIVYHERLDCWQPGAHAGTFRGNQLAMAAGVAGIDFMREYGLVEHAAELGRQLLGDLRQIAAASPCVREVRGRGLMIGVEVASTAAAVAIQAGCLARGLIVELGGRDNTVVRLLPPLVLTRTQAGAIARVLSDVLDGLAQPRREDALLAAAAS